MKIQVDHLVKAVFDDIVSHAPDIGPTPSAGLCMEPSRPRSSRHWGAVAAATIVIGGVGALFAVERAMSGTPDRTAATVASRPADPAPRGAVVFDRTPDEFRNAIVTAGNRFDGPTSSELTGATATSVPVRRWYVSNVAQPESEPWIAVNAFPTGRMSPDIPDDAEAVTVQRVDGYLYDAPAMTARSVAFTLGDTTYVLAGNHITDSDLLLAAEHLRVADDGYGAVIGPAGLTNGLSESAAGTINEQFFISRSALEHPIPQTHWNAGDASLWVVALVEDPAVLPLHRVGYATVTDASVHGQPAYVTTLGDFLPEYRGVIWSENGVTYLLGSNSFNDSTLVEYANLLRPATDDEWNDLTLSTTNLAVEQQAQGDVTTSRP